MIEKVKGVVINERDYGESSKIIDVFTLEHGLISIIAKGVKRLKSELRATAARLTYGYFHIYYKENKLSTLIAIDIIDNLKYIKTNLSAIGYTSFICELVGQVVKQIVNEEELKTIFYDFTASIIKINEGFDSMLITNILEIKLLDYLGVKPKMDECAICGNNTAIITVSASKGGFLCTNCRVNEEIVQPKTIKILRLLYYVDIAKISKLDVGDKVKLEINKFINEYYDRYTGLYLRTKQFLNNIIT